MGMTVSCVHQDSQWYNRRCCKRTLHAVFTEAADTESAIRAVPRKELVGSCTHAATITCDALESCLRMRERKEHAIGAGGVAEASYVDWQWRIPFQESARNSQTSG